MSLTEAIADLWPSLALLHFMSLRDNINSEDIMREIPLSLPEIGMINSTRFIIGTGLGLLLAAKLDKEARKAVGWSLIAVGTLVSFPVAMTFIGKLRGGQSSAQPVLDRHAA
jgi:hypothetical protein